MTKISVMLALASNKRRQHKNWNRQEIRYYYCDECESFHLTSKEKK